jgi:DNA-binding Xre family transcriptional regulator
MKRQVSYRWTLRELMAQHGMFTTTELGPLLAERGIGLSPSQVHRLVSGVPERLSLHVLAALCDIFDTTPAELIITHAEPVTPRKVAAGDRPAAMDPRAVRPRRAQLRADAR